MSDCQQCGLPIVVPRPNRKRTTHNECRTAWKEHQARQRYAMFKANRTEPEPAKFDACPKCGKSKRVDAKLCGGCAWIVRKRELRGPRPKWPCQSPGCTIMSLSGDWCARHQNSCLDCDNRIQRENRRCMACALALLPARVVPVSKYNTCPKCGNDKFVARPLCGDCLYKDRKKGDPPIKMEPVHKKCIDCGKKVAANARERCRPCYLKADADAHRIAKMASERAITPICKADGCTESQSKKGMTYTGLCTVHKAEQDAKHKQATKPKTEQVKHFFAAGHCPSCKALVVVSGARCYRCATKRERTLCRADGTLMRVEIRPTNQVRMIVQQEAAEFFA